MQARLGTDQRAKICGAIEYEDEDDSGAPKLAERRERNSRQN